MRLRGKFFFVLLAFSLIPLAVVTVIIQTGTARMGAAISAEIGQNLSRIANGVLKLTAENSARILENSKLEVEFALRLLAGEAEAALAKDPPPPSKVFFASDFDHPATAPPDIGPQPGYMKKSTDGRLISNMVSLSQPVFLLAGEAASSPVSGDLMRLTRLRPVFIDFLNRLSGGLHWVHWMYVSLESGLHVSFPGHGGYPQGYDPRQRSWYREAEDDVEWTLPMVDATTGQVTMTAAKRIRRSDGSLAGVAAIDVLITEILRIDALSSLWTSQMQSLVVITANHPKTQETDLMVVAKKDYQDQAASWKGTIESEWLTSENPSAMTTLVSEISRGRSGYLQMPYQGVESIWAFAPIAQKSHFLVIVPATVLDRLPEKTTQIVLKYTNDELLIAGLAAAVAILVATVAALMLSRYFTRPILDLVSAAGRLSRGDFTARAHIQTGDERDQLIHAFNAMVPKLEDHMRLHESMLLAMEVQQNLLPQKDPTFPGMDIAGISIYCDETGGDYYDFLEISKDPVDRLVIVVGDVSGHGVHSALLMASARASLRLRAALPGTLAEIVGDVNRHFTKDVGDSGSFMTLFVLRADPAAKAFSWVRAGHDPAICYDPEADVFEELSGFGPALGFEEDVNYEERLKTDLKPGLVVVIGTDGIWETVDAKGEMFGKARLGDIIRSRHFESAHDIAQSVIRALEDFRKPLKPADDITMVVIKTTTEGNQLPSSQRAGPRRFQDQSL